MTPLRAAVIGVGSMGRNHARVYRELAETRLVGVADADIECARQVAADYLTTPYGDYREMLATEQPDVVSVVVPTVYHYEVAVHALEAGCHVLVEKPITATVDEAERLIQRAEALDRKLMVGHIVRFDPAIQELKRRLDAGQLGRIFQIRCLRLGPFPRRIKDVGVAVDLATHDLDLMMFLSSETIERIHAETQREIHTSHEDMVAGVVRLSGGIIGILDVNWLSPTKVREVTVTGEKGMFRVDCLTQDLYFYENQDAQTVEWERMRMLKGVSEGCMVRYPLVCGEPLRAEIAAFVGSVNNGCCVPVSGRAGLAALTAALAVGGGAHAG